ncbi:MAG: transposase [Psychromonas sp.]|jgi:transposase
MTVRKKYSKEFKLDAIALVVEQKYSRTEAARNLVLSYSVVGPKKPKMMMAMPFAVMAP